MQNLFKDLENLLRQHPELKLFSNDGKLLRNLVSELGLKLDPNLLDLLLSHDRIKQHFFTQVGDVLVFDKEKFLQFVNNKQFLPDSYTAFKNKIGLSDDGGITLVSRKQEVELVWPYKDCVLEGGQTKENTKRDEIFWNTTLAPDDISRLLEPKVFTNWKKYDVKGVHQIELLDEPNNLVIRGNNLLALNSLIKNYSGKIKLIYIDPPYNTGNDSFGYNDRFNHSSWLTFMKNRLQVARELLQENGVIWINVDDNEAHYLKIIMDDLFGKENFIANVIWEKSDSPRMDAEYFSTRHDHILVYAKHKESFRINQIELDEIPDHYNRIDENGREYYLKPLRAMGGQGSTRKARPNLYFHIEAPDGSKVYPKLQDGTDGAWRWSKEKIEDESNRIEWVRNDNNWTPYYRIYAEDNLNRPPETIWPCTEVGSNRTSKSELTSLFPTSEAFSTPKPEALLKRIIHLSSSKDDIVLDFFAGSGTTGAVSLKMGRRFILIEQLESIEKTTIPRIRKVIEGEQGGISKSVNWNGGGEFLFCNLMQWNDNYAKLIMEADKKESLMNIWQDIQNKAHLSYKVDIKTINENIEDFEDLSIEEQKKFLLEVLDKNALYVNFSEIDDVEYGVSDEDKRLNRQFYGVEA